MALGGLIMKICDDFREWQPNELWADEDFLRHVPASARTEVLQTIRPLSPNLQEQVWRALFAGIQRPFDYVKATGWMHRLLRSGCELPESASHEQSATYMAKKLPWPEQDVVLLVPCG